MHFAAFHIHSYVQKCYYYLQSSRGAYLTGEMELEGLTQLINVSGDLDRLGCGGFQRAG